MVASSCCFLNWRRRGRLPRRSGDAPSGRTEDSAASMPRAYSAIVGSSTGSLPVGEEWDRSRAKMRLDRWSDP